MFVDKDMMLSGDDIRITEFLTFHNPTIREIREFGVVQFYNIFLNMCAIPSDKKSELHDKGFDYMKISEFELFAHMVKGLPVVFSSIVFGDFDFSLLIAERNRETGELRLRNRQNPNIFINEDIYKSLVEHLRTMLNIKPKVEKAANKFTKMILIQEDREKKERNKNKPFISPLHDEIVTLVNTEEFPYNYKTVQDVNLYQLNLSYYQICGKKQKCALLQGSMSGFLDTKKLKAEDTAWVYTSTN